MTPALALVLGVLLAGTLWLFLTERVAIAAIALMLYLGLLDGYLKLSTGDQHVTLVRDVLLYAVVIGMLARAALRGDQLRFPPLAGWVLAYAAVVLVQLANPSNTGILHTLGALRPHLEFVPLFFLGYLLVRSVRTLRIFLLVLLLCATANGVVAYVQSQQTPDQLAAWGPGYAAKVYGTGDVSVRVYFDEDGEQRVRPPGLGGDFGAGATLGLVSIGAAIALVIGGGLGRTRGGGGSARGIAIGGTAGRAALLVLAIGPPLALLTGQSRSALLAGFVAVLVFLLLATSARRIVPVLATLLVGVALTAIAVDVVSGTSSGAFDRYKTISPDRLAETTDNSRGGSIAKIPRFIVDYPVGGGLGSVGPASGFAGGGSGELDGETQPTFLLSELGIAGLLVMLGFNLRLLQLAATRVRRFDERLRPLLAALAAGLAGLLVTGVAGATVANSPGSPFFWCTAGVLAYWLAGDGWREHGGGMAAGRRVSAPSAAAAAASPSPAAPR